MTRIILLLCVFCLTFTACLSDEVMADDNQPDGGAIMRFSLVMPARMQMQMQTRSALSESDENEILSVYLLMFKEINGVMTYYFGTGGNNIQTVSYLQKTFEATIPTGEYDIVILANAREIIDSSNISTGDTKENVLKALVETHSGKWSGNAIPMWGRIDGLTVNVSGGNVNSSNIEMVRMLAKIDVEIMSPAKNDFTLTEVRLYNYSSQGALTPDLTFWPADNIAVSPTQPSVAGGYATVATPLIYNAGDGVTADRCTRIIYAYEAPAGSVTTPSGNICLVIGGRYRGGAVTYYKVDFAGRENGQQVFLPLLRNNCYSIKVVNVSSNGYSSPEIALASTSDNMNTILLQWTEKGMNNVVFDGGYMLGVSTRRITLQRDAYTTASENNRLMVLSTVPTGWIIEKITDVSGLPGTAPWLTLSSMSGASGIVEEVFVYAEKNTVQSNRVGYIYIRSEKLLYYIEVIQSATPGFGIDVTDLSTHRPVDLFDFTRQAGQVRTFSVEWRPATARMTVYVTKTNGGGFSGTGAPESNIILSGNSQTYTVTSNAVAEERLTRLDFTLTDGTATEVKTLFLRQK
jgi:hypothetical protein